MVRKCHFKFSISKLNKFSNRTDPSTLTLGFGKQDIKDHKEGFEVPAEKVLLHQKFESDYLHDTNDIALIKVKDPISFTKDVRPVCLSQKGELLFFCKTTEKNFHKNCAIKAMITPEKMRK